MKNFRYLLLLSSVSTGFAVPVTMPNAQVLATRLNTVIGSPHFNKKTGLAEDLGGRQLDSSGVAMSLECAICDYKKMASAFFEKFPIFSNFINISKPDILKALLQDSPEAIEELKNRDLLS